KKKLLLIFLIIIIFIGGYFVFNEYKKKLLVNEAQEKAEEYVMENYEKIDSVQITPDNYRVTSMVTVVVGEDIHSVDHLTNYINFLIVGNVVAEQRNNAKPSDFPEEKERLVAESTESMIKFSYIYFFNVKPYYFLSYSYVLILLYQQCNLSKR